MNDSIVWPQRFIINFHLDEELDWVADLNCGHARHVRHDPPWQNRAWVAHLLTRRRCIGEPMACKKCHD